MKVTAETITDAQIRALRNAMALSRVEFELATYQRRSDYRDFCARVWNARYGEK